MYFEILKNLFFSTAVIQHIDFEVRYTVSNAVCFYFSFRYACDRSVCTISSLKYSNEMSYYPRDEFT